MPLPAKIVLSDKELQLIHNDAWFFTKQCVIEKVVGILQQCITEVDLILFDAWRQISGNPSAIPKISRGENYLGLPYVVLDYPRLFHKQSTLAVRTMFWWANFFSVTLYATGSCKELIAQKIMNCPPQLYDDLYLCISKDPWQHHFKSTNYVLLKDVEKEKLQIILMQSEFVKIAYKINLDGINDMHQLLQHHYKELAEMLTNYQGGETILLPGIPTAGFDL
ncbi:MAG: hypothetical protein ABIO05_04565 [Ferruginibacter sp.]